MNLIRFALPAILLLFFAARSFRQRVFLLGIPFLMFMSDSVFFQNAQIFWVPGRFSPSTHLMIWLVIVWLLYFDLLLPVWRRSRPRAAPFGPALSPPEELVIAGIAGLAVLEVFLSWLRFGELAQVIVQAKGFIYLFVGYFLLRAILCSASRRDTLDFVKALVVVNTAAAGLFILHQGLQLPIYEATEYQTVTFMGQRLTRSFYFMPPFLILSLAYMFARRTWTVFWGGAMIVTLGALWVSYTRSLLIIALVVLLLVLGVRLVKRAQAGLAIRRAVVILGIGVAFVGIAFTALPVQSAYFASRIGEATATGSLTGDANLQNRQEKLERVYDWLGPVGPWVGQGFGPPAQDPQAGEIRLMSSDLVWVPILYRLGLVGVLLVVLMYGMAALRALRMTLSGDGDAEFLALVLLGVLVGTLLEGFVSWTFLNPARYPMGLWVFALLAAETWRRRAKAAPAGTELLPAPKEESRAVG